MASRPAAAGGNNWTPDAVAPGLSTLLITNLPPDVGRKTLLDRIMREGPLGKLYSMHLDTNNPFDPKDRPIPHATIAFFQHRDTLLLRNLINSGSIALHGYVLQADWTEAKMVPETDDPAADPLPNPSRIVIITGPEYVVTRQNLMSNIKAEDLMAYHRIVEIAATPQVPKFAVLFTTYSVAKRAIHLLRSPRNNVTTTYGRDPMETGVRVKLDRNNPDEFTLVFSDWIPDDAKGEHVVQDSASSTVADTEKGREKDNGHSIEIKEDQPNDSCSGGWWRVPSSLLRDVDSTTSMRDCVLM